MTLSEFKAWFEGFTEGMDGPPSLKQWERIQARVKEISGQPVTQTVFVDRYFPAVRPLYAVGPGLPYATLAASNCRGGVGSIAFATHNATVGGEDKRLPCGSMEMTFDSHAAMNALGRSDAEALKAA